MTCDAWCRMMQRLSSRVLSLAQHGSHTFVLDIPEGISLWEGVSSAFSAQNIRCAHLDLMGAHLRSAVFYTGYPDPAGKWIAKYGAPNHITDVMLVGAMGIYGRDSNDGPMLHCHGCLVPETGLAQGGHLETPQCLIGRQGLRIYVTATHEIEFAARLDATSGMHVFHPQAARVDSANEGRSASCLSAAR